MLSVDYFQGAVGPQGPPGDRGYVGEYVSKLSDLYFDYCIV